MSSLFKKYILPVLGIGMMIGTYFLYENTQEFLANATLTEGTVVKLIRTKSSSSSSSSSSSTTKNSYTYYPLIKFKTQNGSQIEFKSSTGSNPPSYSRGETVEILYEEHSPKEAKINSFFSLWAVHMFLGGFGFIFFLIGLLPKSSEP